MLHHAKHCRRTGRRHSIPLNAVLPQGTGVRIKICGITNPADAVRAADLGADAIGLNFFARSKRYINEVTAAAILKELPLFVEPVAVFVQLELIQAIQSIESIPALRTIQWHGGAHKYVRDRHYRFIHAFQVAHREDLAQVTEYLDRCHGVDSLPAAILLDGRASGQYGGTGRQVPWELLADFRPPVPLILAGGLTPENVADAIRIVRPFAVDVASGVESVPGRKDEEKMRRFVANGLEAAARYGV